MRTLLLLIAVSWFSGRAVAGDCGNNATPKQIANAVEEAVRQKKPLSDGRLVVSDEQVAIAIHHAVAGAVFSKEMEGERPFRAVRSGDYWFVYGCQLPGVSGGVATIIRARDGAVISVRARK